GHVPALALHPGAAVRPGALGHRARGHPHPRTLGRERAALRRHRRRRRLRGVRTGGRDRRAGQLLLVGAGGPGRTGGVPGGRHARQRRRRTPQLPGPAPLGHPQGRVGPRRRRPGRLPRAVGHRARQHRVPQRVPRPVGAVPQAPSHRRALPPRPAGGSARAAAGRGRPAVGRDRSHRGTGGGLPAVTSPTLRLPDASGALETYTLLGSPVTPTRTGPARSRTAYAAAHVVADPLGGNGPGRPARLDWDATLAFRHHLWDLGLGVADAMDTAQRGMGLDWAATAELIRRSAAEAATRGAALVCGVGTDQLEVGQATLESVIKAYGEQLEVVQGAGATPVIMARRALAAIAGGPEDYAKVYGRLLAEVDRPVVLHWLGAVFDPALDGYWGHADPADAIEGVAALIADHAEKVDGIKVSLLDASLEVRLRS